MTTPILISSRNLIIVAIISVLSSCSVLQQNLDNSDYFNDHFTGFILQDPATGETLHAWNADKYFIPASNTKLLSVYAGLKLIGDSIPSLVYQIEDDSLYFTSTGDPSFLHPSFSNQPGIELLKDTALSLAFVPQEFKDTPFADGWAWEDYQYYYQPERSVFPLYGNSISFQYNVELDTFEVIPPFFNDFTDIVKARPDKYRAWHSNIFSFKPDTTRGAYRNRIPFNTSEELSLKLLQDTLGRPIRQLEDYVFFEPDTVFSMSSLQYYAYLLKTSDNFFAEQLLYLCATEMGTYMNSENVRKLVIDRYMADVSHKPQMGRRFWLEPIQSGHSAVYGITPCTDQ